MTIDYNVVTYHSVNRAMERTSMKNERSAAKNVALALSRGKGASEFSSWERNYLINVCSSDCTALAYNNYCYVVTSEGVCVTMYPLPVWFGKKKRFDGKEHIRNCKKYLRSHCRREKDFLRYDPLESLEELHDDDLEDSWEALCEERA